MVTLLGYECNRIQVGPFERGPIRIVFDGHTNADIPPTCDQNRTGATHVHIVNAFLVDDAEIAVFLSQEFGLPTFFADIGATSQGTGELTQRTWTWGLPGQASSSLSFPDDGNYAAYPIVDRIYWERPGGGLGMLDFTYDRDGPLLTDREGYGTMNPPMLWAQMPSGEFEGPVVYFPSMEGSGAITLYDDSLCEHPESLA